MKRIFLKESIIDVIVWTAGCVIYAVSLNAFTAPNNIAPGGVSGLSTLINHIFGAPIGITILILNIPLFVVGWKYLGLKFILKTAIVTVMLSVIIDVLGLYLPTYNGDKLLAAIFGGLLSGAGLSLIFLRDATSGGTDILARLMQLKYPHLSMGRVILFSDFLIVSLSAVVYWSIESALYAVITMFVNARVIDSVLYGTGNGKVLMIVTDSADEIAASITKHMKRGVTILPVKGGYTGKEKSMLYCAVRHSEVARLNKAVYQYDPNAFITVLEAGEIIGQGFNKDENLKRDINIK